MPHDRTARHYTYPGSLLTPSATSPTPYIELALLTSVTGVRAGPVRSPAVADVAVTAEDESSPLPATKSAIQKFQKYASIRQMCRSSIQIKGVCRPVGVVRRRGRWSWPR